MTSDKYIATCVAGTLCVLFIAAASTIYLSQDDACKRAASYGLSPRYEIVNQGRAGKPLPLPPETLKIVEAVCK